MKKNKILVYDPGCPKCRFIGKLVRIFDLRSKFTYYSIRSKESSLLLHDFFKNFPYNFHFIIDDKDLCYSGLKAIPLIFYEIILGVLWPYGSEGPFWMHHSPSQNS